MNRIAPLREHDDERIRRALADLGEITPDLQLAADDAAATDGRRRSLALSVAAGLVVAAGVGAIVLANRVNAPSVRMGGVAASSSGGPDVSSTVVLDAPTDALDVLLHPDPEATVVRGYEMPMPDGRWGSTLIDRTGRAHAIGVIENFSGPGVVRSAEAGQRIGELTVSLQNEDGNLVYAVYGACAIFTVSAGESVPWDQSAVELLEGVTIGELEATVPLPPGWHDLGAGPQRTWYELEFVAEVDGSPQRFELAQAPASALGAFAGGRMVGESQPISVGAVEGWVSSSRSTRSIAWQTDDGTAVVLTSRSRLDVDGLLAAAAALTTGHGPAWASLLDESDGEVAFLDVAAAPSCRPPQLQIATD